tara:strand:+ start:1235 stop:1900 length:666 start_codon:yes stop_codon:yes gene_type:complete
MKNLTLVIPAKEEKESLPQVLNELKKYKLKKIVVLEKKDINTIKSIRNHNCTVLFQRKKGYGAALIQGIKKVKTKYFCIFNADGSFQPKELRTMMNKIKNEKLDLIFGSRYEKGAGSDDDTLITLVGNYFFSALGKILFKLNISDILYTYVIGDTVKVINLNLKEQNFNYCVELPIKANKNNLKISSISSYERPRIGGKKKVNAFRDGLSILICMLSLIIK